MAEEETQVEEQEQTTETVETEETSLSAEQVEKIEAAVEQQIESQHEGDQDGDETPAVEDAAGEEETGEGESQDAGDDAPDDELLRFVETQYGVSRDQLKGFTRKQIEDGIAEHDRRLAMQAQQPQYPQPQQAQQPQQQQFQQPPAQQGGVDWNSLREEFDERLVGTMESLHRQNQQLQMQLQRQQQVEAQRQRQQFVQQQVQQFDTVVAGMGHDELLGKEKQSLSQEQFQNRQRVWNTLGGLQQALSRQQGRYVPVTPELVRRAVHAEFGPELLKAKEQDLARRVQANSRRRMGSNRTTRPPKNVDPSVPAPKQSIYEQVGKLRREYQAENGAV